MLDEWDHKLRRAPFGTEPVSRPVGVDRFPADPRDADPRPDLSVRAVGGLTVVDFVNAEVLFEERTIRELSARLLRLVEGGHTRLLLNLNCVRYASSSVVVLLARLYRRVNEAGGELRLYGVGPVLIDALRICRLDRVVEVYAQGHRIEFASLFEAVSYDLVHTKTRIATPRLVGTCEHSAMTVVYADEAAALGSGHSNIE